ncbi:MAG: EboA domain-containing protein [Granulosicoccus sp.]
MSLTEIVAEHLENWVLARLSKKEQHWLCLRLLQLEKKTHLKDLHVSLGLVPRVLERTELQLSAAEIHALQQNSGLHMQISDWTTETAARILLLCKYAIHDEENFGTVFKDLCQTADLRETITLYKGLAFYPHSDVLDAQVGEGLRTNIRAVFEAIVHFNPYPNLYFDENRWNHMVLKALFIDSTLWQIHGLDERANPELASILCDYAHERWSAHRPVSVELWRCVGPFAGGKMLDDLLRVCRSSSINEREAGLAALKSCPDPMAQSLLSEIAP